MSAEFLSCLSFGFRFVSVLGKTKADDGNWAVSNTQLPKQKRSANKFPWLPQFFYAQAVLDDGKVLIPMNSIQVFVVKTQYSKGTFPRGIGPAKRQPKRNIFIAFSPRAGLCKTIENHRKTKDFHVSVFLMFCSLGSLTNALKGHPKGTAKIIQNPCQKCLPKMRHQKGRGKVAKYSLF